MGPRGPSRRHHSDPIRRHPPLWHPQAPLRCRQQCRSPSAPRDPRRDMRRQPRGLGHKGLVSNNNMTNIGQDHAAASLTGQRLQCSCHISAPPLSTIQLHTPAEACASTACTAATDPPTAPAAASREKLVPRVSSRDILRRRRARPLSNQKCGAVGRRGEVDIRGYV